MVIVLVGPMGCGKTTIGKMLAEKTGWDFEDADDFHPKSNIAKMAAGTPLNDDDRAPWLQILHDLIQNHLIDKENLILACSALKKTYRRALGIDQINVISVFLQGSLELLEDRISLRDHQYMNKNLLQSQLDTLEAPVGGITVDISGTPESVVARIQLELP